MRRDRNQKLMILSILIVGVFGLSIAFATGYSYLTISSSANVKPADFKVVFAADPNDETIDKVSPISGNGNVATIDNTEDPKISGLHANFTGPNESVVYEFYALNKGKYKGYLKSVTFNEIETGKVKTCKPVTGEVVDANLLAAACNGITVTVKYSATEQYTSSVSSITNHGLEVNNSEEITVVIDYDSNATEADGKFTVNFGAIGLTYSSAD